MKVRIWVLFIILIALGQLVFMQFFAESGMIALLRCLIMVTAITLLGDGIGQFVLRLPMYNYAQFFSYLKVEIINQSGFMAMFAAAWSALSLYINHLEHDTLALIIDGGLVPAVYYMLIHMNRFNQTDTRKRRLKQKIT